MPEKDRSRTTRTHIAVSLARSFLQPVAGALRSARALPQLLRLLPAFAACVINHHKAKRAALHTQFEKPVNECISPVPGHGYMGYISHTAHSVGRSIALVPRSSTLGHIADWIAPVGPSTLYSMPFRPFRYSGKSPNGSTHKSVHASWCTMYIDG